METCPVCALDELLYPLECTHKLCLKCLKGVCAHAGALCPYCRVELSAAYKSHMPTVAAAAAVVPRASTETLAAYRARIHAAFRAAGQVLQCAGEKKVAFNRRVKAWAAGK